MMIIVIAVIIIILKVTMMRAGMSSIHGHRHATLMMPSDTCYTYLTSLQINPVGGRRRSAWNIPDTAVIPAQTEKWL